MMLNYEILRDVIEEYKKDFVPMEWKKESYKWEAVKWFQDHWDVNAPDFADMLNQSLAKTYNLLTSANNFPKGMIVGFAKTAPEEVRSMFIALFDESKDICERIETFKQQSAVLLEKYGNGAKQHFQRENSISVYLWLRYPDKYYIYKISEIRKIADELKTDYPFKNGAYAENIRNYLKLYDEICAFLKEDTELKSLLQSQLTDTCYPDPELRTLTIDVGFYISRYYSEEKENNPSEDNENTSDVEETELGISVSNAAFKKWFSPIIDVLLDSQGSAPRLEVHGKLISKYNISESELAKTGKSGIPLIENQFDWARNYLNYEGFLDPSAPNGIWALSDLGKEVIVTEELAGRIIAKWVKIKSAQRKNLPVPNIDLTPYYVYRSNTYSKQNFLQEVFMTETRYDHLVGVLRNKKNIILQGAPGVGKTFAARRLAWSMMGEKDDSRVEFVQFHQNYSYEDFVMGYKPSGDGFELKYGVFYRFCQKAANQPDKEHFFIIDEINRGNMSKIFGELLMLIENDYRGTKATLAYNGLSFSVPKNLYIIGMMNTADRSLAMIDYALRRRFSFFDVEPGFDSEGFTNYQNRLNNETLNDLIAKVKELNREIALDKSLGKGFCIGHSYFCGKDACTDEWLHAIVDYDILPMLREYWFDDAAKLQLWENNLQGVFQ